MKRNIAVFTGTRADYGLLHWVMKDIQADSDLSLQVIVGAMHLSPEFGETWQEIAADGFSIDAKVEMILSSDTPVGVLSKLEAIQVLHETIDSLHESDRELVQLKFFDGLKYREISEKTGLSVGNVGYRLHHILKELAGKLQPLGMDLNS